MAQPTMDNKNMNNNVNNNAQATAENMFKTMNDNFKTAVDNSIKFQQETMKAMSGMWGCCDTMGDCQGKMETLSQDAVTMVRKNAEQTQKAFDESCKNGINMMKKSFETAKTDNKDMFAQARDMWMGMFDMMKGNVDAMAKTTATTIENMSEFVSKTMDVNTKKSGK